MYFFQRRMNNLAFAFADDEHPNIASTARLEHSERAKRVTEMTGRLKSPCVGLLEVAWGSSDFHLGTALSHSSGVYYLHLTVKEFLEKPRIQTKLTKQNAGTGFDANVLLLKATIVDLRPDNPQSTDLCFSNLQTDQMLGSLSENDELFRCDADEAIRISMSDESEAS